MKKQITRSYLEYLGVTDVTKDGKIFTKNGELKPREIGKGNRLAIKLHDPEKYKSVPKEKRNCGSGQVDILVYHVIFAWFNGEVPYGKEIHHKDSNYLNNNLDNLEALSPAEHRAKHASMREKTNIREEKCRLDIPREHYVKKIEEYEKTKDYSSVSHYRARLKYYDNHIKEAQSLAEFKKDCMELNVWKQVFKENKNKKLWRECVTIEKMVKEKGIEAKPVVEHALEVAHKYFGRG